MSKGIKIFLSIILAVTFIATGVFVSDSFAKETLKIGVSIPLTGSIAFLGESYRNAVQMAQDQMKDKDLKYNYEMIFEDSQNDPKNNLTALEKFRSVDHVDAMFTMGANAGFVVSPEVAKTDDILHFTITTIPYVTKGLTNFNHWTSVKEMTELSAQQMEKRKITRCAVFRIISNEGYKVYAHEFFAAASRHKVQIIFDSTFQGGEKNFQTEIAKMKQSKPDIIMLFTDTPELELITKQLKEAGVKTPITSVESFEVAKDKTLWEGMWYISVADPAHSFEDEYVKRYGTNSKVTAPNAYDIFNLYVMAAENAKPAGSKPTPVEIAEELLKIKNFPGALGKLNILDDGSVSSPALVKKIIDGKSTLIKP